MSDKSPTMLAKEKFDSYAGMDSPDVPEGNVDMSELQVKLSRWQNNSFGGQPLYRQVFGMMEELGELCHAQLKHEQGIRGFEDREFYLEKAGDSIADIFVFGMQLATNLRLDVGVLLEKTAEAVMNRNWKANPTDADKQ